VKPINHPLADGGGKSAPDDPAVDGGNDNLGIDNPFQLPEDSGVHDIAGTGKDPGGLNHVSVEILVQKTADHIGGNQPGTEQRYPEKQREGESNAVDDASLSRNFQSSWPFVAMFFSKTLPFSFWGNVAYLQSGRQRFPDGLIFARAGSNAKIFLAKNNT